MKNGQLRQELAMDAYSNLTRASWHSTIDRLEEQLEAAREMPPWAVAVIVLCALSLLSMLVICGFGCGLLVQQHVNQEDQRNRLLASDSAVHELELQDNAEPAQTQTKPSSKKKGKQRVSREDDDMEL